MCYNLSRAANASVLLAKSSLADPKDVFAPCADLRSGINEADAMFVDGYQEAFRVIWISCLLKEK